MLKRLAVAVLVALAAYVVGAALGGWLLYTLSSNPHDREVEAAMTGAFVFGPLAAAAGLVAALALLRSRSRR